MYSHAAVLASKSYHTRIIHFLVDNQVNGIEPAECLGDEIERRKRLDRDANHLGIISYNPVQDCNIIKVFILGKKNLIMHLHFAE